GTVVGGMVTTGSVVVGTDVGGSVVGGGGASVVDVGPSVPGVLVAGPPVAAVVAGDGAVVPGVVAPPGMMATGWPPPGMGRELISASRPWMTSRDVRLRSTAVMPHEAPASRRLLTLVTRGAMSSGPRAITAATNLSTPRPGKAAASRRVVGG